jgi:hypothetical protein
LSFRFSTIESPNFGDMFSDFDMSALGTGRGWGHDRGYGDGYGNQQPPHQAPAE